MRRIALLAVAALVVAWVGTVQAATDEEKCLAGRAAAKGKFEQCVEKWLSKLYGGAAPDYDTYEAYVGKLVKCRSKYAAAWTKLQRLTDSTTCVLPRFVDNGDGTVTDNLTGLMWEKKSNDAGVHYLDMRRIWSTGSPYKGDGSVFYNFLKLVLNDPPFVGARDWRIPSFAELQTIVLPEPYQCTTIPCVDAAFNTNCTSGCSVTSCSCTSSNDYWSSTTVAGQSNRAWTVDFYTGGVDRTNKDAEFFVRGVRGGL